MPALPPEPPPGDERARPDLRVLLLGAAAWTGCLAVLGLPPWCSLALLAGGALGLVVLRRHGRDAATVLAVLLVASTAGVATGVREHVDRHGAVAALAAGHVPARVVARLTSDPVTRSGRFGDYTLARATTERLTVRGVVRDSHVAVLVMADGSWGRLGRLGLGSVVALTGRLAPAQGPDLAAVLTTSRPPELLSPPGGPLVAAAAVRAGVREAVAWAPRDARALVPALVVGDDQQLSTEVADDFRTCGLTHLAAVSGTNLTLVVGFLLVVARWAGIRAHGLVAVGVLGVVAFVLLARPEPSVLRAAVMGSVSLVGMGSRGRDLGVRALGVAVLALLLVDPWLAVSAGFALSTLATGGILLLGPPLRDALRGWLPLWAAEAFAVPFAAQLACTPLVAAISGQVSLVAVVANLLVAAVVGPATVLGLLGGLLVLVLPPAGHVCGWLSGLCATWIVVVATRLAALPSAALDWSGTAGSLVLLTALCLAVAGAAAPLLRHPRWSVALSGLLVVVMLRPLPSPGWPPRSWVLVACDVGQGDGLVLHASGDAAVVVDTGPDPRAMGACLRRLGVHRLPVVVLTHFHADHVDGLPAVLHGRRTGEIDVTATEDPPSGARAVHDWAAAADVPVRVPAYGEVRHVGDLTWQVIGPVRAPTGDRGEEGSVANNASLVLLVEVLGVRLLMSGDMEPEAQQALDRALPDLRVDVLKVPHHGSRYQDPGLLDRLGARLAVVSVGRDNDYGHPAAATLALLRRSGMHVERTDRDGDVAVTVRNGRLGYLARGSHGPGR